MNITEFRMIARIDEPTLEDWLQHGWLRPGVSREFSEIDLARARLISDLREQLQINEDGIDVILDLLDQLHGLRAMSRGFSAATRLQPVQVRRKLRADVRRLSGVLERRR
jgi:chaperone modulatory protein CbpM